MAAEGRRQQAAGRGRGRGPPFGGRDRSPVIGGGEDRMGDAYPRREHPPPPPPHRERPEGGPPPTHGPRDDPFYPDPYRRGPPPPPPMGDDPYRDPYRRDPYRRDPFDDPYRDPYYRDPYGPPPPPPPPKKPVPADVQIICMNEKLGAYAESLDSRLRESALIVDIVIIPGDMSVAHMVEDAARLKFLFAIIINSQNELHKSLTLNILHGTPQEHRNMPMEDAMKLVATSFEKYIQTQREKVAGPTTAATAATTAAAPPPAVAAGAPLPPFHPPSADVSYLLNLLADNRHMTVEELEKVISYLSERKDKLVGGARPSAAAPPTGVPAPASSTGDSTSAFLQQQQQELQSKILNILNGSSSGATQGVSQPPQQAPAGGGYPGAQQMPAASRIQPVAAPSQTSNPLINFDNPNVKKALDSLIQSGPNLLKSLPSSVSAPAEGRVSSQYGGVSGAGSAARQPSGYAPSQGAAPAATQQYGAGYGGQYQQQAPAVGRGAALANYPGQRPAPGIGSHMPPQAPRPRY